MTHWSPRQQLTRLDLDEWIMRDGADRIAVVRQMKVRGRPLFRAVTWAEASEDRRLLGYFPNLDMLAWIVWREWLHYQGRPCDLPPR